MGACTMRMGSLLGTKSMVTEKLGRTSPSAEVAKEARRMKGLRAMWSTAMQSRLWGLNGRQVTPIPLLLRCRFRSRYPTRSRHGLPLRPSKTVSAVNALRLSAWAEQVPTFLTSLSKRPCRRSTYWILISSTGTLSSGHLGPLPPRRLSSFGQDRCSRWITIDSKYAAFRDGINPHVNRVDSVSMFHEFISAHPIDFAFVCID